jgi:phage shock protein C
MKRLYRSVADRKLAGVCGGLGEFMEVDPTVVRLVVVIACLATGIVPFLIGYVIAWFIVPEAPPRSPS